METNHDGEIDHPCSGRAVTCLEGMGGISGGQVSPNIGRNSDHHRAAIDLAALVILVTIDRRATRDHRAQFNTEGVTDVPITTDRREPIGIQAVPGARVTAGLRVPTLLWERIGPRVAQVVLVAIGPQTAAIRRPDQGSVGVPANIGSSCSR